MAGKAPAYRTLPTDAPLWVSEPFRVFFPLGIAAGLIGLLLWPLFYAGWWPIYPALQHPRLMIFGFGTAFVMGFLGTAWPRFLESEALKLWELTALALSWLASQIACLAQAITLADLCAGWTLILLAILLGRRLFGRESRDWPPPGFALAFLAVVMTAAIALTWALVPATAFDPKVYVFLRLLAWQGFLLFPILGVGSYLFTRFFQIPGQKPQHKGPAHRALAVWTCAAVLLVSFAIEALAGQPRLGNALRLAGLAVWAIGAVPVLWTRRAPNTRAWGLRIGLVSIALTYLCRVIWPGQLLAFEHLLFLGGFSLIMLLTADRVIVGHSGADPATIPAKSKLWRWIVWLVLLAAATRATADLVPSTRVSHHIYASVTLVAIFIMWMIHHRTRLRQGPPPSDR